MSDVAVAKVCRAADIPVPPRGYWAKLAAGRAVIARPALPPRGVGKSEGLAFGKKRQWGYEEPPDLMNVDLPPPPTFPEPLSTIRERVSKQVDRIRLVRALDPVHPLIQRLLGEDEQRRQAQLGKKYQSSCDDPLFGSPFEQRRLRIVNAVFLACEHWGARAIMHGSSDLTFGVRVSDQSIGFEIDTPSQLREDYRYQSLTKVPAQCSR